MSSPEYSSEALVAESTQASAVDGGRLLKRDALDLRHAVVISVAVMSPAASVFFNTTPMAQLVGAAVPLCFVVGFVVALLTANQYSELSREMPSSGSAYTYVSEGLGPRWGFLTGWIGLIAVAIGAPYSFVFMSANLQTLMYLWFGINLHWSFYFVAAIGIVFAVCYLGIRQSLGVDMLFLAFEIGICLVLALIILLHVGNQGGLTAAPFSPASMPPGGDLAIGIVLGVLNFIGFETAATLGEETRNPRRNIPLAIFGSMIVVGVFYVVMAYAATVGYGLSHMVSGFGHDAAPFDTLSRRYGGSGLAVLIDLVGVFSFFSAALAIVNGGSRILFSVARDGLLPRFMAWTHPKRHTPAGAITALRVIGVVVGIGLGLAFTPIEAFAFLGTLDALFILLIYILLNVACLRFFWRNRREQFSFFRHGVCPVLGTLVCIGIVAAALASPGQAPLSYIPVVVGVWIVAGVALLVALRSKFKPAVSGASG
jgi:amino acid transporter